ncbi:PH domain-containing protein [Corynebacterium flavescens]|uniref:Bacterial Pleckstrin homology domain-containing protein n=2 Tax=Corynebacterium flavescens TaxID=28028 RepID=A0A1L7CLC5_CORFL|nr:PH domain-containing protein [Corynebacterium flavescens]APT86650.1 hypothetical protein CFLV_05265 [Corynebacterium flavescens]KAA8722817.1 PH domain-containing protein [Corynebacterium flavescens]MDN6099442.1 PH domain-containing protein [Corynebacterium flavescens]MDN6198353.1 PH domain-containing protein [Corynebacterium flavescens]MDN6225457.1 PH domain-containing protein [Corynebacterium flavescens]
MALEKFEGWTFYQPCPIPDDIQSVLAVNEQPSCAFKTIRDAAVFTNYRLIIRDSQGLTGKKVEMYSIPYSSINMWSTENAGKMLDINAELELWTRAGHFKINIGPKIDIRALDQLISNCVFQ